MKKKMNKKMIISISLVCLFVMTGLASVASADRYYGVGMVTPNTNPENDWEAEVFSLFGIVVFEDGTAIGCRPGKVRLKDVGFFLIGWARLILRAGILEKDNILLPIGIYGDICWS